MSGTGLQGLCIPLKAGPCIQDFKNARAHGKAGNGNGHGKRKRTWNTETTFTRSVFCANFWFMTDQLDACMCAVVCDKLVWTVLCAVR